MNNTKHTPTPWTSGGSVIEHDGETIAQAFRIVGCPIDRPAANAAFIVRAVNSHAALVNALTLLSEKVAADGYFQCQDELLHARAALALAKD